MHSHIYIYTTMEIWLWKYLYEYSLSAHKTNGMAGSSKATHNNNMDVIDVFLVWSVALWNIIKHKKRVN